MKSPKDVLFAVLDLLKDLATATHAAEQADVARRIDELRAELDAEAKDETV